MDTVLRRSASGNILAGLTAAHTPLVIPRAHEWPEADFLVVQRGQKVVATFDERAIAAA